MSSSGPGLCLLLFHLYLADVLLTYSHHGEKRRSRGGIFGGDPRIPHSCLPYPNPEPSVSTKRGMDSGRSWVFLKTIVGSLLFWLVLSAVGLALETGSEGLSYLISGGATYFQSPIPLKVTRESWLF